MREAVVFCGLALVFAWSVHQSLKWLRRHRTLGSLPSPKVTTWVGGHAGLLSDPRHHHTLLKWTNELGGLFVIRSVVFHTVVVSDPVLIHSLMKRASGVDKAPIGRNLSMPLIGHPSLFSDSTSSPYWKAVRKGVATAFNMRSLKAGFQHVQYSGRELLALVKAASLSERVIDIDDWLMRESLDVIGRVGFNDDFGALKGARRALDAATACESGPPADDDLLHLLCTSLSELSQRWANPLRSAQAYLPGSLGAEVRGNAQLWGRFMGRMKRLLRTIKERGPPSEDDASIAAHLLRLEDPVTGGPLSDERLAAEIATLLAAGMDTTAHTMAWTLYLVSQHPEVEARLCAELEGLSLLATPDNPRPRQVAFEDLSKLPYLTAVVKESMRLIPVSAGGTPLEFPHDIELRGHTIPANTTIWVQLFCAHNSTRYWDEPERFDPDRFLKPGAEYWPQVEAMEGSGDVPVGEEEGGQRKEKGSPGGGSEGAPSPRAGARPQRFFPFSLGARDCVGQSLAKVNYTTMLATLWGNFSFRLAGESAGPGGVQDVANFTLQPANGLKVAVISRVSMP